MDRTQRLLILDDDPDLVEAIREVLREEGYEVETRVNRSITDVVAMKPDLLFVDCAPGAEGEVLSFIQRVRLKREICSIPIILGSASLRHLEPGALRDQGIHVLVRPFELDDLLRAVRDMLQYAANKRGDRPS